MPNRKKGMCNLKKMIETCNIKEMVKKVIGKDNLEYSWKGKNAQDVENRFTEFCKGLKSQEKIIETIKSILKWGGIRIKDDTKDIYGKAINELKDGEQSDILDSFLNILKLRKKVQNISSWSKLLAACTYNTEDINKKFWIYDSRVAIALNIIWKTNGYSPCWYMPSSRSKNNAAVIALLEQNSSPDLIDSYKCYCKLLRKLGPKDALAMEQSLFMFGGLFTVDKGGNIIIKQRTP